MPPNINWKDIMKIDPDDLPRQEELADNLLVSLSKVQINEIKNENQESLIHLFRVTQSLMKMKAQEVELALEEVEKAGEEQAKFENQLKSKMMKLENELEMAQQSAGGRDTRFLRDEIRQLEKQLEQKDRELEDMEKELEKEKKVNEQLALRNEEAENENSKLRRENKRLKKKNEQLRQDIIDYQKQIDSHKETLLSRRGEDSDYRSQLSKKNYELVQYLDEIQTLTEANEKIEIQNQEMRKNLEESVQEMEKMTDEYNRMKAIVHQTDSVVDQLKKENEHYRLQVQELTQHLKLKNEEDDPVMAAVNAKVEEWKLILSSKDDEIIEYQQMLHNLREKLKNAQLDADKSNVMALQQGVQERDSQIKMLTEQVEQYTKEMEKNTFIIEDLKTELHRNKGASSLSQQTHYMKIQSKLQSLEEKTKEAERIAELAESDAREKDKELVEALKRLKDYESGVYGLEDAVVEIKNCKNQIKIRDREIEELTKEINTLELKINDFLDENEALREQAGFEPKSMIDLTEFRNSKRVKQQQYRAENQILLKEIESLEEERLDLKKKIRQMAQERGKRAASSGLTVEALNQTENFYQENVEERKLDFMSLKNISETQSKNEILSRELIEKERDLEKSKTVITKFQNKIRELAEENKQLEEGMKEILQAIKEMQKDLDVKGGETSLIIPSLERLVNAIESKNTEGIFDANLHLKAQVDQLTGRNEELRQELREARKEAINYSQQLAKANLKIDHLDKETNLLRQSEGSNVVFKGMDLPEGIAPSSANIINSQNEYLIHLLQEIENKEKKLKNLEDVLEEYNRKFAVIRHQQSILYKEYLSEKETWRTESVMIKEEKRKLEDQIQQDAIKVKEYNNLLSVLQMDSDEIKKLLSENSRKITVLQVNEKSLIRQYTTLVEMERQLRKENGKQKSELLSMEAEVCEKIGCLQRFKEMAMFKIAALQKVLDNSVSLSELDLANKQYNELTAKYRDILQKDNMLVQRTTNLEHIECENASLKEQMGYISKELEITKEKLYTIEQAWEQDTKLGNESNMDKTKKSITNSEILSISKKITMLEMKELNERQRAEHSQKMYEHLRTSLKQIEERNFELETKFAELTKINMDAQKVEQMLRDELADSVSKAVSDADRQRILELEKNEMELKVEAQSDEKALIAKLHQHIVSLQISEAASLGKLESITSKLQKMEAFNLRLEQKLDEKEQALYYARLEGRNRAKHLRQTIQSLRRQFSGALPLAQQEKFSKTMIQLQNDKLKIMQEMKNCQNERRNMENKSLEMELKLKGLEELISTLKDSRGAQKVISWHMKIEELRLQELKLNRELVKDKEEIKYLSNIISEYEHTISSLEEEIVQQNKFHEERQMAWDQREVELERQLDIFDRQQNEILSAAQKFEEAAGSVPDPSLPLPNQLEIALRKIKENVRIILETQAACKSLEEKLKEKESALWLAEQNILSRDKVINELRLRLPATAEREKLIAELGRKEMEPQSHHALKIAHQTIANMQARLNQKEEVLKKYQHLLEKAREEQREIVKKHEDDLHSLYHKLELQADSSLNKFKQTAWDLMKQPPTPVPTNKHFIRLAEMEQIVAEQDDSLSALLIKLKKVSQDLERQKEITALKIKEFENTKLKLQENHADEIKKMKGEVEDLRCLLTQSQKESQNLRSELQAQKEANLRAPTTTMRNLVERLKSQLALKEKQQKALSQALLQLRAEMTAAAEERIISATSQKEANLNVQQIVDQRTRELKSQIEDLRENLLKLKETLKTSKNRENTLADNLNDLNIELQKNQKAYNKILREKDGIEKENDELKRQIKRLTSGLQGRLMVDNKQSLIEELQKKIKKLESELEKRTDEAELKPVKEKSAREELIRWEEGKKWQTKVEGIRNKLKEKEGEVYTLTKQLNTLKDLFAKADKEKLTLQKKLKTTGMTVDQVIRLRALESEKELEELKKRNIDLESDITYMRTHQALPRDSVLEDLRLQNKYLQDKLHVLEKELSKDAYSKSSTSGTGSEDRFQKEQELQRENLKLSSENIELKFQLEQANKDLPRLKNQVRDLKEMCEFLKKEKTEVERKLGQVRGSGRSGKTIPELEKTIGLMKKVVEKVQRENEQLKKASGILTSEKMANIEQQNEKLKAEQEKLKAHLGRQLSIQYESRAKGTEKIVAENERLRKELKKETEAAEKLRIAKNNLEILNEKITVQLEETGKRLQFAESRGPQLEGADGKSWKSIVVTRMYETKLKELETDIDKKNQSIIDLKQLVREAAERELKVENYTKDLEQQIEILKHVPDGDKTEQGLNQELQVLRLANSQLEKENAELMHKIQTNKDQSGDESTKPDTDQLKERVRDLETQLRSSDLEKQHLKEQTKRLKKELENFDPSFFEEIEDLKYNYKEEVKKNILLEEKLKKLSEQFGVEINSLTDASEQLEDEESPIHFPIY
ncbi:PREDICTED: centrosomal protein of 290 kDa [Elephantulus edwardii]|uniref:centrosomal protein of 290 kDa n=1 Tax=Elephantulus edwardii TaxID=28737 RepID=UPI0003F0982C|nr:PREDICTED: centrosomal protein of 290 kDa [Elephantulus edwardii]